MSARRNTWGVLALAALVAVFVAWQLNHLGGFAWDWDEAVYAMTARLVAEGNALYRDVFANVVPLFINSLNLAFALAGDTIPVGRAVIVLYSAVGLLAVGLIARELGGWLAALGAVAFLALAPHFYMLSRVIVGDIPSMSLGVLALWPALRYTRTGRRAWLAAAGLSLALGAMIKLTAGLTGPAIVFLLLAYDLSAARGECRRWRQRLRDAALSLVVMGGAFLLPVLVYAAIYPPRLIFEQLVMFLWVQGDVFVLDRSLNAQMLQSYLVTVNRNIAANRALTLLSLAGAVTLIPRRWRDAVAWWVWFGVVLAVLVGYSPLWSHLLSPILFPLAVGAGVALGELAGRAADLFRARGTKGRGRRLQGVAVAALALLILGYVADLPLILRVDGRLAHAPDGKNERRAVEFLERNTAPDEYVISDDPALPFAARRRIPPNLADTSIVRMSIHFLTADEAIRASEKYSPAAVVLWQDNRFRNYLPEFVKWVEERYILAWGDAETGQIYLRPDRTAR